MISPLLPPFFVPLLSITVLSPHSKFSYVISGTLSAEEYESLYRAADCYIRHPVPRRGLVRACLRRIDGGRREGERGN